MSAYISVLIVEDVESDAQLIVRLLKQAGYEVIFEQVATAQQMSTALELLKETASAFIPRLKSFSGFVFWLYTLPVFAASI